MNRQSIKQQINHLINIGQLSQHKIKVNVLFGYHSINYDNVIFALIYDEKIYLKGNEKYHKVLEELKMKQISMNNSGVVKSLDYFEINEWLWKNPYKLNELINMVISQAINEHEKQVKIRESRLKDLPNMNTSLERLLFKSGIPNVQTLSKVGPYESFYRLLNQSPHISENILYILYSALKKVHVHTLTSEDKKEIFQRYQKYLDNC